MENGKDNTPLSMHDSRSLQIICDIDVISADLVMITSQILRLDCSLSTMPSDAQSHRSSDESPDEQRSRPSDQRRKRKYSRLPEWETFNPKKSPPSRLDNRCLPESPWTNWEIMILTSFLGRYQSFNASERKQLVGGTIAPLMKVWWKGKYDNAATNADRKLKKEWDAKKKVSLESDLVLEIG